jgi:hypothetical protein
MTKRQLLEHGVSLLKSIISSPSKYWWEHNQPAPDSKAVYTAR